MGNRLPWRLSLILGVVSMGISIAQAGGHPPVFFPGQAFCPPRTLVVGRVAMQPQQCFSVFLMRTGHGAFLGFAPAGSLFIPSRQSIGLRSPLGARIRAQIVVVLPIAIPTFFVPVDTIRLEAFQVEDLGGALGVRLAEDLNTLVPIPSTSSPQGASRLPSGAASVPLPTDLQISPPGPGIPQDEAAFSGKWIGRWKGQRDSIVDEGLPHVLVIEQITRIDAFLSSARQAVAIFAWGSSPRWGVLPGWVEARGAFERGTLQLTLPDGMRAAYRMAIDGTLDATYAGPDVGIMRATLSPMRSAVQ